MRAAGDKTRRGREGEELVASTLAAEGWSVVARNFRWKGGEVDIVAARGGILCFVEVKSWDSMGRAELESAIGADKRRRIVETAKIFLSRYREYNGWSVRFDVVLVRGDEIIERYPSAFTGEL
jgi:Predicted endonuclease distantly related to archaeal Holliday junction resolvase